MYTNIGYYSPLSSFPSFLSNSNTTALVRDLDESMQRIDPARRYPFPPSTPVRILYVAVELGLVDRGTVWMSEHVAQVRD